MSSSTFKLMFVAQVELLFGDSDPLSFSKKVCLLEHSCCRLGCRHANTRDGCDLVSEFLSSVKANYIMSPVCHLKKRVGVKDTVSYTHFQISSLSSE